MKKRCLFLHILPWAVLFLFLFSGCTMRPTDDAVAEAAPTEAPIEMRTVSFYWQDKLLGQCHYSDPADIDIPTLENPQLNLLHWEREDGALADPLHPSNNDEEFYAIVRPVLNTAPFLAPNEYGCIRSDDAITNAEAQKAFSILLEGIDYPLDISHLSENADAPLAADACATLLQALAAPGWEPEFSGEAVTRGEFAASIDSIRETGSADTYFPDNSPASPYYSAVCNAGISADKTAKDFVDAATDGLLWLDGYLYRWDGDQNCFLVSEEYDGLVFDGNGRYTSGNDTLDAYVAETIAEYCDSSLSREENLKKLYQHVKNDFKYLPRNYYDSGETGWEIDEALTMFETGKGNCYCFTGAFCALARGLGYNAMTWSGTMGTENQPHAWTEITMDDKIYICDPEIELNYWLLEMYTDNFMMPKSQSGSWNYQAVGRDNAIPSE